MSKSPRKYISEATYLELEHTAQEKHGYDNGQVIAMTGASARHNYITLNIGRFLSSELAEKPCRPFVNDLRLKVHSSGMYTYPDAMIICDRPEFTGDRPDTVTNPTVIFEVLSASTEGYDRGAKFGHYREIPNLRAYLLVHQEHEHIEQFSLRNHFWTLNEAKGMDAAITIASLELELPLAEVYHGLDWLQPDA